MPNVKITIPATDLPVTLEEAKAHFRYFDDDEDALIEGLIRAATNFAQKFTGRSFLTQTILYELDCFPGECIELPRPPAQSITSFQYIDYSTNVLTTVDSASYTADLNHLPPRIVLNTGYSWPVPSNAPASVKITYVAGYGAPISLPQELRLGILMLASYWFDNRDAAVVGANASEIPFGVEALFYQSKHWGF